VGVEKLRFPQNSENLEDRKCLGKSRTSFIGHPDAILFLLISREGVFQHQLPISLIEGMTGQKRKNCRFAEKLSSPLKRPFSPKPLIQMEI
jgi:hypothetical protein